MSNLSDKYTRYSIYKMFIDALEEDGAVCSYSLKYYDENETFKGGTGSRLSFTRYNDRIRKYHNLLKVLTGEKRADISETIPVIDMFDVSNSSLLYTYPVSTEKKNEVDPTVMVSIEEGSTDSSMDLLEREDRSIINRAVMGHEIAEHFYGTKGLNSSEYNIQVSPPNGESAFIYNGVVGPTQLVDGKEVESYIKSPIKIYSVNMTTRMVFNPLSSISGISDGHLESVGDDIYFIDNTSGSSIILNTDCGFEVEGVSSPIMFCGERVVYPADSEGNYYMDLEQGDYVVAIPARSGASDYSRLLVFKSVIDEARASSRTSTRAVSGYLDRRNGKFYRDSSYSIEISNPSTLSYYMDESAYTERGEFRYYTYSKEAGSFVEADSSYVERDESDASGLSITVSVPPRKYQSFILYISDFSDGVSSALSFEEIRPGDDISQMISPPPVVSILRKYISISEEYYSNASGLLAGYYCEPAEWTSAVSYGDRVVSRWKFRRDGDSIPPGRRYYRGHLLNKGNMIESPLKLTDNDRLHYGDLIDRKGIKGKASLLLELLREGSDFHEWIVGDMVGAAKVDNWSDFTTRNLDSVITRLDYSMDEYKGSYLKYISGEESMEKVPMHYANKFSRDGKVLSLEDILEYIDRFEGAISQDGRTLTVNGNYPFSLTSNSTSYAKKKGSWLGNLTGGLLGTADNPGFSTANVTRDLNQNALLNDFDASFVASYNIRYNNSGSSILNPLDSLSVSLITPRELFTREGEEPSTILVMPEYNRFFPETAILMSRYDLGLDVYNESLSSPSRGIVSFLTRVDGGDNDRVLMFRVSSKKEIRLSEIRNIRVIDDMNPNEGSSTGIDNCCGEGDTYLCRPGTMRSQNDSRREMDYFRENVIDALSLINPGLEDIGNMTYSQMASMSLAEFRSKFSGGLTEDYWKNRAYQWGNSGYGHHLMEYRWEKGYGSDGHRDKGWCLRVYEEDDDD